MARWVLILSVCSMVLLSWRLLHAQQQTLAFSSVDSPNANWYIAKERQLYKKYGLDAELIFIPSSTTTVSAVVAGSVAVGNISGGATANAAVGGAGVVAVGCFINTLPYELIVHESIRSAQQLKGKAIGISRVGSSSDVAARLFLKELKLEPDKDVAILQVGGSTERAAAFRTGRIVAFPSPPRHDPSRSRYAASGSGQHGGFSERISVSLCVPDDVEELSKKQSRCDEAFAHGTDRSYALLQDEQGRK
jgi:ABC-type nitrate/sulfonate/bicarbonate transport system substrate-binding protein